MKNLTWRKVLVKLLPMLTLVALVVIWQAWVEINDTPRYLLPSPTDVFAATQENWSRLLFHGKVTLVETLLGFGLSVAVGVPLAVAIVYSKWIENMLYPLLVGSQAIPKIAIAPLLLVWLGFGMTSKVLVAFLIAFFPVVVATATGLRGVSEDTLRLVESMGASTWQVFRRVRFPTSVPSMLGGFKVAIALAVVGAVVGEFVGANAGLGHYVLVAGGNFNTPLLFASVVALTVMGVALFYLLGIIEARLNRWAAGGAVDSDAFTFTT